jgi:hypothetical protein
MLKFSGNKHALSASLGTTFSHVIFIFSRENELISLRADLVTRDPGRIEGD